MVAAVAAVAVVATLMKPTQVPVVAPVVAPADQVAAASVSTPPLPFKYRAAFQHAASSLRMGETAGLDMPTSTATHRAHQGTVATEATRETVLARIAAAVVPAV